MSQSPREPEDVDATATQSPNDDDPQPQINDQTEGEMSRPEDVGYDFEVKEQDRWLPIANGESLSVAPCVPASSPCDPCPTLPLCSRRRRHPFTAPLTPAPRLNAVTGVASCPHITLHRWRLVCMSGRIRGSFASQRSAASVSTLSTGRPNRPCRRHSRSNHHPHPQTTRTSTSVSSTRIPIARTSIMMLTFITLLQSLGS